MTALLKFIRWALVALNLSMGAAAFHAGVTLSTQPNPLGMTTAMLRGSPFSTFFIPGLLLGGVIGVGCLSAGLLALSKNRYAYWVSGEAGIALIVWISVQVAMLGYVHFMQPLCFAYGALIAVLAALGLRLQSRLSEPGMSRLSLSRAPS